MYYQSKIIISKNNDINHLKKLAGLTDNNYEEIVLSSDSFKIGIEEVQNAIQKLSKKNEQVLLFIIQNSQDLTTEAQNSLLKIVEEPNKNIQILFHTINLDKLLITIISRCGTIYDKFQAVESDDIDHEFKNFINLNYKEKRNTIEKFLKEDHNKNEIKKCILVILNQLAKSPKFINKIEDLEKAYKAVDLNVSSKLIFDFIILSFED